MTKKEQILYLKSNFLDTWIKERGIVNFNLSNQQSIFCICGKLATGLHERSCTKFNKKVDEECRSNLEHLIKGK